MGSCLIHTDTSPNSGHTATVLRASPPNSAKPNFACPQKVSQIPNPALGGEVND